MSILGCNTNSSWSTAGVGVVYGSWCTAPAGGTLTDLTVVFHGSPTGNVHLGVYADNGSAYPGSLLLDAGEQAIAGSTVTFTGLSLAITQGVTYWMCLLENTANSPMVLEAQGAGASYGHNQTYGALPATFPSAGGGQTWSYEIYGTIANANNVTRALIGVSG